MSWHARFGARSLSPVGLGALVPILAFAWNPLERCLVELSRREVSKQGGAIRCGVTAPVPFIVPASPVGSRAPAPVAPPTPQRSTLWPQGQQPTTPQSSSGRLASTHVHASSSRRPEAFRKGVRLRARMDMPLTSHVLVFVFVRLFVLGWAGGGNPTRMETLPRNRIQSATVRWRGVLGAREPDGTEGRRSSSRAARRRQTGRRR